MSRIASVMGDEGGDRRAPYMQGIKNKERPGKRRSRERKGAKENNIIQYPLMLLDSSAVSTMRM